MAQAATLLFVYPGEKLGHRRRAVQAGSARLREQHCLQVRKAEPSRMDESPFESLALSVECTTHMSGAPAHVVREEQCEIVPFSLEDGNRALSEGGQPLGRPLRLDLDRDEHLPQLSTQLRDRLAPCSGPPCQRLCSLGSVADPASD